MILQGSSISISISYYFTFRAYPEILCVLLGKRCGYKINRIANHIQKVTYDTDFARTTRGDLGIATGQMAIEGILAAPFTAGASLAVPFGRASLSVPSDASTLTSSVIKDQRIRADVKAIKTLVKDLKRMDDIVNAELSRLKVFSHQQKRILVAQSKYRKNLFFKILSFYDVNFYFRAQLKWLDNVTKVQRSRIF